MTTKIKAIELEVETYHKRNDKEKTAWVTIEIIEKILDGSYFNDHSCSDNAKEDEK